MWCPRKKDKFFLLLIPISFLLIIFVNVFTFGSNDDILSKVGEILETVSTDDLIAMVFWEENNSEDLRKKIIQEKEEGKRDQVIKNYF